MKLIVDFILVIGILMSLGAMIGMLLRKEKKRPQYILAVFWFLIFNVMLYFYATLHELWTLQMITNFLENGVRFFIPPLIYIYVKSIFLDEPRLIQKNLKHFFIFIVHLTAYVIPKTIDPNTDYMNRIYELIPNWGLVQDLFGIIYFVLALHLFYKVSGLMKQSYSNRSEKKFLWIEKFLISFLLVLVVDLIITLSEMSFGYRVDWDAFITVFFIIVAMGYLGYYGFSQTTMALPQFLVQEDSPKDKDTSMGSTYIKEAEKNVLKEKFDHCMRRDKLYLSPDLSLKSMADVMEISDRKLSAFFSEVLESSFYDSVNAFRVEEAKELLASNAIESHSITGIGLSCGFSSKSSFYRVFKKSTNVSPLAYRKSMPKGSQHT